MSVAADPTGFHAAEYRRLAPALAGREPAWLTETRARAIDLFQQRGFPTTRDEEWRFTSVRPIADSELVAAPEGAADPRVVDAFRLPGAAAELVFVDGRYAPALSSTGALPAGVVVCSLAEARGADLELYLTRLADGTRNGFVALNTALWTDGALLQVPAGAVIEAPVHLLFLSAAGAPGSVREAPGAPVPVAHPRVLMAFGRDSQATIVESYAGGASRYFTNAVTEAAVGDHAVVQHVKLQREGHRSFHIATFHVRLAQSATFTSSSISFGGGLVRNDIVATLDGEGAECTLNGLYLADGDRLVDNHTTIDHARANCSSREVYKGILSGDARGVFNGKIVVRPHAQKTDAKQTNKALLLSGRAQINTKPQLEIFANDVKCTHGAAIGQIDDEAIFYLRARGIGEAAARQLLIRAFAGDILDRLPIDALRARIDGELTALLPR